MPFDDPLPTLTLSRGEACSMIKAINTLTRKIDRALAGGSTYMPQPGKDHAGLAQLEVLKAIKSRIADLLDGTPEPNSAGASHTPD
jgi:hypothetical protein